MHYGVSTGEHYQIYQAKGDADVLIVPTAETARSRGRHGLTCVAFLSVVLLVPTPIQMAVTSISNQDQRQTP